MFSQEASLGEAGSELICVLVGISDLISDGQEAVWRQPTLSTGTDNTNVAVPTAPVLFLFLSSFIEM